MKSILQNEKWFWKTIGIFNRYRFREETSGIFTKQYTSNDTISINIEKCTINYGRNADLEIKEPSILRKHKDLVVLYVVDQLLTKGFARKDLVLFDVVKSQSTPDVMLLDNSKNPIIAISCFKWGKEYEEALLKLKNKEPPVFNHHTKKKVKNGSIRYQCVFSCLLDGGLPHIKYVFFDITENLRNRQFYFKGIFEKDIILKYTIPEITSVKNIEEKQKSNHDWLNHGLDDNFIIEDDELINYIGKDIEIVIPFSIKKIGIGAFWNCVFIKTIHLNEGLIRIGGDAFYKCDNLEFVNIPSTVREIGNDPFAGCPNLTLKNKSEFFSLEDGVLYNKEKTEILHYPINKQDKQFFIPNTVQYINKHTFYGNPYLRTLIIPESVIWMENNLFSGCCITEVINSSPYFSVDQGVLYNHEKSQVFSVFDQQLNRLKLPESVQKIGKNSFFGCENLEYLHIPKNIHHIGYNPFVKCPNLTLSSDSSKFQIINEMLVDCDRNLLIFCPNATIQETIEIPPYINIIGRNSFCFCSNLKKIHVPKSVQIIERGAFASCNNLEQVEIPNSVKKIEKWAFSHCPKLEKIEIAKQTHLAEYIFTESPTKIIRY